MSKDNEDSKENPFSFRNFLTNPTNSPTSTSNRTNSGTVSNFQARSTTENADYNSPPSDLSEETNRNAQGKKQNSDKENPYSFKRFLRERDSSGAGISSRKHGQRNDDSCVLSHSDLPDFVQDHFSADNLGAAAAQPSLPIGLPDFGLPTVKEPPITGINHTTPPSASPLLSGGSSAYRSRHMSADLIADNSIDRSQLNSELINGHNAPQDPLNATSSRRVLPDFLSDSGVGCLPCVSNDSNHTDPNRPVNGSAESHMLTLGTNVASSSSPHILQIEIERLNQEKINLLSEVAEKDNQLDRLRRRLREKETREADETAAMENILKQVETNLQTAKERASRAEQQVKKLKEENKHLRTQMQLSGTSSTASNDSDSSLVSTKAKQLGKELSQASSDAETLLKQLLTGVDKVKFLSEVLQSLDKFSECQSKSN